MSFISSPTITADKIERFIQILKPRQEAGVKVSVILTKPENRCYGNTDFYLILIEKMKETGSCQDIIKLFLGHIKKSMYSAFYYTILF